MKKFALLLFALMLLPSQNNFAQLRISVQPGIQIPIGDFSNTAAVGLGVMATAEFIKSQKKASIDWSFTISTGYNYFSGSEDLPSDIDYTYTVIPIQGGIRYYLGRSDFKPYLGAELGFQLLTITVSQTSAAGTAEVDASDTYFGFAPIAGFKLYLTSEMDLDINVKLNSISSEGSSLSYIGFNFGVQFGL